MRTATKVREVPRPETKTSMVVLGKAAVYRLSEPCYSDWVTDDADVKQPFSFVFVSTSTIMGEPETYAFACEEDGKWLSHAELDGSEKGDATHEGILRNLGYELVPCTPR